MKEYKDFIGKKINDLTIVRKFKKDKHGFMLFECVCICGKKTFLTKGTITSGHTKSCGCLISRSATTNGFHTAESKKDKIKQKFYDSWRGVKKRTMLDSRHDFKHYKGRGIKVCKRWLKFDSFKKDMYLSYLNHIKIHGIRNTSIDRIDVNGDYKMNNCKWSTSKEQARNRSNNRIYILNGVSKTAVEWAEELGVTQTTLSDRMKKMGWTLEKTLTTYNTTKNHAKIHLK